MSRILTAQEMNHLVKHGIDPFTISEDVKRPVEYITKSAVFYGRDYTVNQSVLIPRIETEGLIRLGLEHLKIEGKRKDKGKIKLKNIKNSISFTDIGTGSGIIGITFALELMKLGFHFKGVLSDIEKSALEVARCNLKTYFPTAKELKKNHFQIQNISSLQLLQSDLLQDHNKYVRYDIIFANLPYIPETRKYELQDSVKDFEPHVALFGGSDGLLYISQLLEQASPFLKKSGVVLLEVDDTHDYDSKLRITNYENWNITVLQDQNEKVRYWNCKKC